ncbi:hypothetical protein [Streptomyces sp. NPDC005485]|uniref:hypothetical protein n=1 Tax=Streptomyces sp. NPDC005485 TaxID=3155591 RepID=UPI0033AA55E5
MFVPADPPRTSSDAFWRPYGEAPPTVASGSPDELGVGVPAEESSQHVESLRSGIRAAHGGANITQLAA